jgi:hypothetical protein
MVTPKRDNASLKNCGHETSNEGINSKTLIQQTAKKLLILSGRSFFLHFIINDFLCLNHFCQMFEFIGDVLGLVVTGNGYRSRGPGSIPGAPRFSEK